MRDIGLIEQGRDSLGPPRFTLVLTLVCIGLYLLLGPAPAALVFDRGAVAQGQWWRLITGHFVHSDIQHALWNIAAWAILAGMLERRGAGYMGWVTVFGIGAVDLWLWWGASSLQWYCGLSGLLNTLLVVVLMDIWWETRRPLVVVMGAMLVAKLILEIALNQALFTHTAWPSVPWAHAAGFAGGLMFVGVKLIRVFILLPRWPRRSRTRKIRGCASHIF